ncbi:MAG: hypothetical protein EOP72_01085 [Variovorax sp.]|jgi:hypothetical protein|nr:MAG: hypothetical protein EOP72_01085 [Variovorax sp.]
MRSDHHRHARLSDDDLSGIAQAMRLQTPGSASSMVIADALDTIVRRRCEAQEARRQRSPARIGLRALRRLTCWASVHASMRIGAALGRSQT